MGRYLGTWLALVGAASFTVMGVGVKVAVPMTSTADVVFWRSLMVASVALALCRLRGVPLWPGRPGLLAIRSVTGLSSMLLFFWSLSQIELATATALLYSYPIFMVLLSRIGTADVPARGALPLSALGFAGVVSIVEPQTGSVSPGAVAALLAALGAAVAHLAVRNLRHSEPPERIVWWFAVFCAAGTAPFCTTAGLPPAADAVVPLLVVGLGATGGQLFVTAAYRVEQVWIVGPLAYSVVLFSWLAGVLWFAEHPSPWALAGAGALLFSGVGISLLGRRSDIDRPAATKGPSG